MRKRPLTMVADVAGERKDSDDTGANRPRLLELLRIHFRHSNFRGLQLEAVEAVLSGNDCFCLMATGGGKSLCYEIPALAKAGIVIVISPLISLMESQVAALKAQNIKAEFLCSAQTSKVNNKIHEELESGRPSLRLLYVTPEMMDTKRFVSKLQTLYGRGLLTLVAVDEAHCISSWGHEFRPSYRKLSAVRVNFPGVPILALTATASKRVQEDVIKSLNLEHPCVLTSSLNRPNIDYEVRYKDLLENPYEDLLKLLKAKPAECCIIYCNSKSKCNEVGAQLLQDHISCRVYHADLGNRERSQALDIWSSGKVPIMVATVAFGMGIDRNDVRMVLHFDAPMSLEGFYQESGRAGRDGLPARSILYYGGEDRRRMQYLASRLDPAIDRDDSEAVEKAYEKNDEPFSKVRDYCESARCRRQAVLALFGEKMSAEMCAKTCDFCKSQRRVLDSLEELGSSEHRGNWSADSVNRCQAPSARKDPISCGERAEIEAEDDISDEGNVVEDKVTTVIGAAVRKGFPLPASLHGERKHPGWFRRKNEGFARGVLAPFKLPRRVRDV